MTSVYGLTVKHFRKLDTHPTANNPKSTSTTLQTGRPMTLMAFDDDVTIRPTTTTTTTAPETISRSRSSLPSSSIYVYHTNTHKFTTEANHHDVPCFTRHCRIDNTSRFVVDDDCFRTIQWYVRLGSVWGGRAVLRFIQHSMVSFPHTFIFVGCCCCHVILIIGSTVDK